MNEPKTIEGVLNKYRDACVLNYAKWKDERIVDEAIKRSRETTSQTVLAIKQILRERTPNRKEHIAILSNKELSLTGKLVEGRTVKDWIKYGYNQYHDEWEQIIKTR